MFRIISFTFLLSPLLIFCHEVNANLTLSPKVTRCHSVLKNKLIGYYIMDFYIRYEASIILVRCCSIYLCREKLSIGT